MAATGVTAATPFLEDDTGATAIEYALIAALVSALAISSAAVIGGLMTGTFDRISRQLATAGNAASIQAPQTSPGDGTTRQLQTSQQARQSDAASGPRMAVLTKPASTPALPAPSADPLRRVAMQVQAAHPPEPAAGSPGTRVLLL